MMDPKPEANMPSLLSKLGKMTAIRDTYLLEQSVLRTLGPLLGVLRTSLYRIDEHGVVERALHHSRSVTTDQDGVRRVEENIEDVSHDQGLPPVLRGLIDSVRMLGKSCSRKLDADLLVCYPLHADNEVRGYFVFMRDREPTPVEDAIVRGVLEVFTNYHALLDTSQRDRLTGLLNRYSLEINLDRLWNLLAVRLHDSHKKDARRDPEMQTYWLGMFDIDHFKNINDSHGHVIGDEILILVSRLLEGVFRRSDLLYRYGGEEFVAIIAANDLKSAVQVFERARAKIEQFHFPQVERVTISGGFSGADPTVLPQEVLNRADRSLYEAKKAGRNRIFHYDDLVTQGVLTEVESGSIDLF